MDKPVKFRPKPVEIEAMPYTGENADAIFKWVLQTDPMSSYKQEFVLPAAQRGVRFDGSTVVTPIVPYLMIRTFSYEVVVWKGMWLVLTTDGIFKPLHDKYMLSKYDRIWPEPLPGV